MCLFIFLTTSLHFQTLTCAHNVRGYFVLPCPLSLASFNYILLDTASYMKAPLYTTRATDIIFTILNINPTC